ncbi:coiled-coil domain-containing protein [Aequorivita viscosa]|uniref:Competence protein CoiA-like family protein n=1 Tax=Aequorivita viscosa TaxID=797419 RepID=A0A1M6M3W1_9FLAO|nr:hypothetical protein [Aequorivita viscosa]SDX30705.1 hypothetical protein SAMN05216556_12413 [Aequorivita viscosa]SHJ78194.1 hypothetical protein SAMN04487908_12547 [Aequorivita viscosa]
MPLEEKKYDIETNNDWAKDVKGNHLYIDHAISGRKGYFCIGCDKEMEAVKMKKNLNHRSFFRHVPVDITKDETPCTFSNRKYRELLATDILQRLKTIKVPGVYKYPPKGEDGIPMLLEKPKFINAHKVKSQLIFYEDKEGAVLFGKNPDGEDRYLLIRPDVVFFDANGEPILLIELVITHKVNQEKKIKLRRLGIDTVSIIVPKSSEQEIEDNFKSTKRVKWEYNEIEANTNYKKVSSRTSEGILELDEDQRRIFEEDISCRKARLNNTLRSIKKFLQSESYRRTEQHLESEISRIEKATRGEQKRLEELEVGIDKEVRAQFTKRHIELRKAEGETTTREEELRRKYNDLERRYKSKKSELETTQSRIESDKREELENGWTEEAVRERFRKDSEQLRVEFEKLSSEFGQLIRTRENSIGELLQEQDELAANHRKLEAEEFENFTRRNREITERIRGKFRDRKEKLSEAYNDEERIVAGLRIKEQAISRTFGKLEKEEQESFGREEALLIKEEQRPEGAIFEEFLEEIRSSPNRFPKRIKYVLEAERVGHDYKDAQRQEEFYKRAREFFKKGTWKEK